MYWLITSNCICHFSSVPPVFLSISPQVDVAINSMNDAVTLKCSVRGYPLLSLHWRKDGTLLDPDGSHINITTLRRQNPMDFYHFSAAPDSSFQPIPLEDLEYFEAVSELILVPPIVRSDTANYTCEVESDFVQNYTVTSDNIPVTVFGECQSFYSKILVIPCTITVQALLNYSMLVSRFLYNIHFSLIPVSTFIQLLLRPVSDCLTWAVSSKPVMLSVFNIIMVAMHAHMYTSYLMSIMSCSCLHWWTHADIYAGD